MLELVETPKLISICFYTSSAPLQYYEERRGAREKLDKTARAGSKAVRAAAARTEAQLAAASTTAKIQLLRKTHWFEKFLWFVTTEGYLVLSGRDAQQNEILVRRCAF